jgi:hypothetical protein
MGGTWTEAAHTPPPGPTVTTALGGGAGMRAASAALAAMTGGGTMSQAQACGQARAAHLLLRLARALVDRRACRQAVLGDTACLQLLACCSIGDYARCCACIPRPRTGKRHSLSALIANTQSALAACLLACRSGRCTRA